MKYELETKYNLGFDLLSRLRREFNGSQIKVSMSGEKDNGATLIEINPTQTPLTPICDIILQYPADTILPLFVREIERLQRK